MFAVVFVLGLASSLFVFLFVLCVSMLSFKILFFSKNQIICVCVCLFVISLCVFVV